MKSATEHDGEARLNQSIAFGVQRHVRVDAINQAIDSIVQRHHMLRVRFSKKQDGTWEQRITKVRSSS